MLRLALLVLPLLFALPAQAQKELRYRFGAGQKFTTTLTSKQVQKMNPMGAPMTMSIEQVVSGTRTVISVAEDGSARLSQTVTRIVSKVTNSMQGLTIEVDTSKPAPPDPAGAMLHAQLSAMVGKKATMRVSARGETSEIKMGETGQVAQQLKNAIKSASLVFPAKALSSGDSWTHESKATQQQMTTKTAATYTYKGSEGANEKILASFKFTLVNTNPMMTVKVKKQEASGTLYFDAAKGYLARQESRSKMTLAVTAGGQVIDQVVTQSTTYNCKPVAAAVELSDPGKKKDAPKRKY